LETNRGEGPITFYLVVHSLNRFPQSWVNMTERRYPGTVIHQILLDGLWELGRRGSRIWEDDDSIWLVGMHSTRRSAAYAKFLLAAYLLEKGLVPLGARLIIADDDQLYNGEVRKLTDAVAGGADLAMANHEFFKYKGDARQYREGCLGNASLYPNTGLIRGGLKAQPSKSCGTVDLARKPKRSHQFSTILPSNSDQSLQFLAAKSSSGPLNSLTHAAPSTSRCRSTLSHR
jgi:hypothetical protein